MRALYTSALQAGPAEAKWASVGVAVVLSAVWSALTGVLASIMVLLFLVDVGLGVLRAIHVGGVRAFDWDRFRQGWTKFFAALLGIPLAVAVDLTLQHVDAVSGTPVTTGIITFMSWGFAWSAAGNLGHWFPGVEKWIDRALGRRENGDGTVHPMRRATDRPGGVA